MDLKPIRFWMNEAGFDPLYVEQPYSLIEKRLMKTIEHMDEQIKKSNEKIEELET